ERDALGEALRVHVVHSPHAPRGSWRARRTLTVARDATAGGGGCATRTGGEEVERCAVEGERGRAVEGRAVDGGPEVHGHGPKVEGRRARRDPEVGVLPAPVGCALGSVR